MDWTRDGDRFTTTYAGHVLVAYRTPQRTRGWTLEVDGVPDDGLTGCCRRVGNAWTAARPLLEIVARGRVG